MNSDYLQVNERVERSAGLLDACSRCVAAGFHGAARLVFSVTLTASLTLAAAQANTIITPNTPTGNVAPNAGSSYASLVNGAGLSFAVTSGMNVASALLAKESTAVADKYVTPASGSDYFAAGTIPVLTFDLGKTYYNVSSIVLWNYQVAVNNLTEFSLDFYSDAAATVKIGSTISGLTATAITTNAQQIAFSGVYGVRSIKLTMTDNNGGNRVGIGEVRFAGTPAPDAIVIKPSAISSTQGSGNSSSPGALIDNSGLSSPVNAEDATTNALTRTHSFPTFPVLDTLYINSGSGDYTLTFTLGAAYDDVNSIVVWNYPYPAPQHSTRYFDLSFYSDDAATVQIGSTLTGLFLESSGSEPEPAQQVYFPGGINFDGVRSIKMTCTNSWNNTNKRALGEVRFSQIKPDPGNYTWNNASAGAYSWSTAGNWTGGVPNGPGYAEDAITFFNDVTTALGSGIYTVATDDPATLTMNSLTLNGRANAGGNTVVSVGTAGNTWTLSGTSPTVNLNGLNNGSSVMKIDIKPDIALAKASTAFAGNGTGTFVLSGSISGTGAITKAGTSILVLTNANSFTGGTTINAGTLAMGEDSAGNQNVNSLGGTSPITINSGAQLRLGGENTSAFYDNFNDITLNGGSIFAVDSRQVLRGDLTVGLGGGTIYNNQGGFFRQIYLRGKLNGSGPLTLAFGGGSSGAAIRFGITESSYSGTVTVNNADCVLLVENDHALSNGTVNVTVNDGVDLSVGSATTLGGLTGTGNISIPSGYDLAIGANNKPTTYSGILYNSGSVTKTGTGTLTLTGANTYSGSTTISAGTLLVNGSHTGGGAYSVSPGGILAGSGTINAPAATVSGVVSPGSGGIGTLTFNGSVTWNGGASASSSTDWRYNLGSGSTADLLSINGNFTKGSGSHFRFDFGGSTEVGLFKLVEWTGTTTFSDGDFSFVNIGGGHSVQFLINGNELDVLISAGCGSPPSITLGTKPSVCLGATSTNLSYSAISGSPDKYRIDYSDAANAAGFIDVGLTALPSAPGTFSVSIPLSAPAGVYTGIVQVIDTGTGCQGSSNFTVTVSDVPAQPGGITQGNPSGSSVCSGSTGVTYTISTVAFATNYVWSVPGGASITAGQGTTQITVDWGAAGSGNVSVYAQNGCGSGTTRNSAITVGTAVPAAPVAQNPTQITTSSFQANWGAVSGALGYYLDVATTPDFSGGFVASNQTVSGTSQGFSGLSVNNAYYYRVRAYNGCGISTNSGTIGVSLPESIAAWDMHGIAGGNYGDSPMAPTTYASTRVDVDGLTRGAGVQTNVGVAAGRGWGGTSWNAPDAATAVGNGQYATFAVKAKSGTAVTFHRINVFMYRRDGAGPTSGVLQFSTNGTSYTDISTLTYSSSDSAGSAVTEVPIDLTLVDGLYNLPNSVTSTFRIVNYGASDAAGDWYLYDVGNSSANDLEILGTFCTTPTAYNVMIDNGGVYCDGSSGSAVRLSGSQSGVSYQLYRDGSPVGTPVSGTGGSISLGLQTTLGTYSVVATRTAGGCTASMSGSPVMSMTTPPGAPTGLLATTNDSQVDLSWTAPAETLTGYTIKRSSSIDGPYTALTAGHVAAGTLTFSDTTAQNGSTYFYTVSATNGPCEGPDSTPVQVIMPVTCPGGVTPTLTQLANQTVLVGSSLDITITAQDSPACTPPSMTDAGLPVTGVTISDTTGSGSRSRRIQWTPDNSQVGTYPITITATDSGLLTTSRTYIIFVGLQGEPTPGGVPQSQTNWSISITELIVPSSGNATVVWESVDGVRYDVYSSVNPLGGGASWSKNGATVEADGSLSTSIVTASGTRYYNVVPAGQAANGRGVWGVVRPSVPVGVTYLSPPVPENSSDLDFSGNLGAALAAVLTDPSDRIYIMSAGASPSWTTLRVIGGEWYVDGGGPYTTPLNPGQGFMVTRASGSTSPMFSGPVGNNGTKQISLEVGYNIIGISEGKGLPASTTFESASPVGNYDENLADQVITLNPNGSFRRLIRMGNNVWYDTATQGTTTLILQPGQSYYYIRRSSSTTLNF